MNKCPKYQLQPPYKSWDLPFHVVCGYHGFRFEKDRVYWRNKKCNAFNTIPLCAVSGNDAIKGA